MPIDTNIHDILTRLLQSGATFFMYCLPGDTVRMADAESVRFTSWPGCGPELTMCTESTGWTQYKKAVDTAVGRLKKRGGKTVLSRVVCGSHHCDMASLAVSFFDAFPDSYRTIFHTPQTGSWMCASPELLYSIEHGQLYTMALAGTRRPCEAPWDVKNLEEHQMVADFVEKAISCQTTAYRRLPLGTLRYGAIEHLLTEFYADASQINLGMLKAQMHPTPAVGGFPRAEAMADIAELEGHKRNLYSGLIEFDDQISGRRLCIVNLRCMQFNSDRYCIYAGGGITARSDAEAEWSETEAKAAWLREHITKEALRERNTSAKER